MPVQEIKSAVTKGYLIEKEFSLSTPDEIDSFFTNLEHNGISVSEEIRLAIEAFISESVREIVQAHTNFKHELHDRIELFLDKSGTRWRPHLTQTRIDGEPSVAVVLEMIAKPDAPKPAPIPAREAMLADYAETPIENVGLQG